MSKSLNYYSESQNSSEFEEEEVKELKKLAKEEGNDFPPFLPGFAILYTGKKTHLNGEIDELDLVDSALGLIAVDVFSRTAGIMHSRVLKGRMLAFLLNIAGALLYTSAYSTVAPKVPEDYFFLEFLKSI